jgi:hypothetical protein
MRHATFTHGGRVYCVPLRLTAIKVDPTGKVNVFLLLEGVSLHGVQDFRVQSESSAVWWLAEELSKKNQPPLGGLK